MPAADFLHRSYPNQTKEAAVAALPVLCYIRAMQSLRKLWAIWKHGLLLAFCYGLSVGGIAVMFFVAALLGNTVLSAVGLGMDEDPLIDFILWWGWVVWLPLGLGMAARYGSSDALKPDGYPVRSRPPTANI